MSEIEVRELNWKVGDYVFKPSTGIAGLVTEVRELTLVLKTGDEIHKEGCVGGSQALTEFYSLAVICVGNLTNSLAKHAAFEKLQMTAVKRILICALNCQASILNG